MKLFLINKFFYSDQYLFYRAMATNCCTSNSQSVPQSKHTEWMRNLPVNLHHEPITKIAIPGSNTNKTQN